MTAEKLLKKDEKEQCGFCRYHKVVTDKNGVRWQVCLTCYNKEKVHPKK
jgi:hypothetical protein